MQNPQKEAILTRRDLLMMAALAILLLIIALPLLTYPLGRDQGEFATIAVGALEGQLPYRDLWNPKPPAIFYTYAIPISIFGNTTAAVRSLDLALLLLVTPALYTLGLLLSGRALGILAAVLFAATYSTEDFWTLSQNDGLALIPMTWGILAAVLAARGGKRHWQWAILAGMLGAVVLWFKYPFVTIVAAQVGVYLLWRWPFNNVAHGNIRRTLLQDVAAFALGGCMVGFGVMGLLWQYNAFEPWVESARVTADYAQLGLENEPFYESVVWNAAVHTRWEQWRSLLVLTAVSVGVWALWIVIPRKRFTDFKQHTTPAIQRWTALWLWFIAGTAAMLIQAKGYGYHWLPMVPPMVLLASAGLAQLSTLSRRRFVLAVCTATILTGTAANVWYPALPYLNGTQSQQVYYTEFRGGEYVASESQVVVDYLQDRTEPGDTLFIWGFRAEVYYLTGLQPASRFIFNFPLVADWYPSIWQTETNNQLWQTMPPYAIVIRGDFMPWVTGSELDSQLLLFEVPDIRAWLEFNYERDVELGNFLIWKRKPTAGS